MKISSTFHAFIVLCLGAPVLAGCNTIAGVGRDISAVGDVVTQTAGGASQGIAMAMNDVGQIAPAAGVAGVSNAVYFGSGSAQLTSDGRDTIRAAAAAARTDNVTTVRVAGYADTTGSADANERLSQRRAQAVAAELAAQGIPRERIAVDWFGERTLPVPTGDGVAEAQNRIVTIGL